MSRNLPKHLIEQVTEQLNRSLTTRDVMRIARIVGGYRMTRRNGALVATPDYTPAELAWFRAPIGGSL